MDRLTAMETFVSVIEAGSFSGAARRLKVGQPAVSKSVAQLETRLGVRLLARSTRGLAPTEAGRKFYERAKRAIDEADEAEFAARGAGAGLNGTLRVCAAVTFARLHVVPHMQAFLDEHPDLSVEFVLDDRQIDPVGEGIDVALRMGTGLLDSSMIARKIGASPRRVIGTPAYLRRAGVPREPEDLVAHQMLVYDPRGAGAAWKFRREHTEVAVETSGRLRVHAAEGVRAAVLADLGLAVASEWMFADVLRSHAVQAVLTDWTLPGVELWAVFPGGRMASAKARTFVAFVETMLSLAEAGREADG
ncbi:LysR family transcriptional regulator [Burkholderia alba]|uniref:LysR family transcriptional regulator n=1 Tax=Burkholderia alba TaxID=2683677 RepID=UPI002B062422|nr:LysR family transcriptional regulator [Burkholderia alba]